MKLSAAYAYARPLGLLLLSSASAAVDKEQPRGGGEVGRADEEAPASLRRAGGGSNIIPADDHRSRGLSTTLKYEPLACNVEAVPPVDSDECMNNAVGLSALVEEATSAANHSMPTSTVMIPCGTCAYVDYGDGSTVTLPHGLDVVGRLHFPPSANVVLNTTAVIVQGVLGMDPPADGNRVKITLFGTDEQFLYPHETCCLSETGRRRKTMRGSGEGEGEGEGGGRRRLCNLDCPEKKSMGKKPMAVAGGRLDINAIDPTCPSWTVLDDVETILEPIDAACSGPSGVLSGDGTFEGNSTDGFSANSGTQTAWLATEGGVLKLMDRDIPVMAIGTALNDDCLMKDVTYRFRFKYYVHGAGPSGEGTTVRLTLWWKPQGSSTWKNNMFHQCSTKPGYKWVECTGLHKMTSEQANSVNPVVHLSFLHKSWMKHDVDFDDISFVPEQSSLPRVVKSFVVDPDFSRCLKPGSDVLVTSDTPWSGGSFVRKIDSADASTTGTVSIEGYATRKFATRAGGPGEPQYAAEVVGLGRDVIFEAQEDDPDELHGGHLIVFHTPEVKQTISGVLFENFGQAGNLGRYPIHFHMSGYTESVVTKNVIRNSNQRCIVIHNTNAVFVEDNVSFRTRGHCYATETGAERLNTFRRNLGAETSILGRINGQSDSTGDGNPHHDLASTFWVRNMENTFIDNVAAGAQRAGWWFEMKHLKGNQLSPSSFKGNVAHSNSLGLMTYPGGWKPANGGVIDDFKSYKNGDGMKFHITGPVTIKNSLIADNTVGVRYGVWNKGVTLENTVIRGLSSDAKNRLGKSCSMTKEGVRVSFNNWPESDKQIRLKNVTFSDFKCGGKRTVVPYFDNRLGKEMGDPVLANDVSIVNSPASAKPYYNGCGSNNGAVNLFMEDVNGTLGPDNKGPGFIVLNTARMKAFLPPDQCEPMPYATCNAFCEDVCLRQMSIRPAGNAHKQLLLSNGQTSHTFQTLPYSRFDIVLPPGDYHGIFLDANDNEIIPDSVSIKAYRAPLCNDYLKTSSFTFPTKAPTSTPSAAPSLTAVPTTSFDSLCSGPSGALKGDGTFESNSVDGFSANSGTKTAQLVAEGGILKLTDRDKPDMAIGTHLNMDCLLQDTYRFRFKYYVHGVGPNEEGTTARITLWWKPQGSSTWKYVQFHQCGTKPGNKWVECTDTHTLTSEQANAQDAVIHLSFVYKSWMYHNVDFDDISFVLE